MEFNPCLDGCTLRELQEALIEALRSEWDGGAWWDFLGIVFSSAANQVWWDLAKDRRRAIWVLDGLRNCRDVVPRDVCTAVGIPCGSTYATLARALKAELNEIESDSSASGSVHHKQQ